MTNEKALCLWEDEMSEVAIEHLKTLKAEIEGDKSIEYQIDLDLAIETLEKAIKYRWHDLRKNPNDLPQDNEVVFVHCKDGFQSFTEYYKGFNCNYYCSIHRFDDVIAWKYIEPFECEVMEDV